MNLAMTSEVQLGNAWAFIGLVLFLLPALGVVLSIAGWIQLRRRKATTYESNEDRRRKLNESRTVFWFGMFLWVPFPLIFVIVQLEKVLFP